MSGDKVKFKQIRLSAINSAKCFLANVKSSTCEFKLLVDLSDHVSLYSSESFFDDNDFIEMLKAADM